MTMSTSNIEQMLKVESEASEELRHEPLPDDAKGTRKRADATVLSVRITKDQYAQLAARAERENVPTSTLARTLLLGALSDDPKQDVTAALEAALRHTLRPDLLAS
jgi:hypothetical protein